MGKMVWGQLVFALLLCTFQALQVCIARSQVSSDSFLEEFSARLRLNFPSSAVYQRTLSAELGFDHLDDCDLVIDATQSPATALYIEKSALVLSLTANENRATSNCLCSHDKEAYEDLTFVLRHFNWTSVSLLYSPNTFGLQLSAFLETNRQIAEKLIVSDSDEKLHIQRALSRRIKQFGSNIIIVATSLASTSKVLESLRNENMLKTGYVVIVVGEAVWAAENWIGMLVLKEENCMEAHSLWQCHADKVAAFIRKAASSLNAHAVDLVRNDFNNYVSSLEQPLTSNYVLANIYNNRSNVVGRFHTSKTGMEQIGTIYYPGNRTDLSTAIQGLLEISFNSGLENPTAAPTTIAQGFYNGQSLGVTRVNQRSDLLPQHTLVSHNMSFGAAQWNASWTTSRILANKEKLGLAYMPGYASAVTMNTLLTFDQLNLSRPVISSSNSLIALGNSTAFPWFVRNGISDLYFAALYSNILPEIGWKRCAVLYGDDLWGTSVYATFKALADFRHIEILNNETLRKIPSLASKQTYWQQYRENLMELFRCNARVVLLFILDPNPQYILELLFDLGARKGDFVITGSWLSASYFTTGTTLNIMKRKELLEGTIGFSGTAWIGTIGAEVKRDIAAVFNDTNPSPFTCFYYDSVFALAYALETCIHLGLDYNTPAQLMKVLRTTRFRGCTGFVSWTTGDNNRAYIDYNIMNLVRDSVSGNYTLKIIGRYSPTSALLFNFTDSFIFGDGTDVAPPDLRIVFDKCPFEDKLAKDFPNGQNLAIGICVIIMFLTVVLSILLYKTVWKLDIAPLERQEISVEDVIFMGSVGVEAVQLAAIGPDFKSLNSMLMNLATLIKVDLSNVISFKNGIYWTALNIAFGVIVAWVFLNIFKVFRCEERLKNRCLMRLIGQIADLVLPLIGNIGFIPLIFVLTDVFICDQVVGYGTLGFTNSILARDCYVECWGKSHIIYVIFSSLSLLCYIPSAILLRPVWNDLHDSLHIKTYPMFLVVKSIIPVVLICLSKTVKRWYSSIYSIVFLCVLAVYTVYSSFKKAYNYHRVNLWHVLSLLMVFVLALLALLNDTIYHNSNFKLVIIVVIAWALLITFGLAYQHFCLPSLLFQKKGRDFSLLLRFAFTSSVKAAEIQPKLNHFRKEGITDDRTQREEKTIHEDSKHESVL